MKKIIFLLLFLAITAEANATLTPGMIPVDKVGGSSPQVQNGSITDTGTASGVGNVGIGSTNPGQKLDVAGTIRTQDFITGGPYTDLRSIPGATPNNAAVDNEPFINTCLNETTTTICLVPAGTWYIDTEITMPSGSFYSPGKRLWLDPGAIIKPFATYQTDPGNSGAVILMGNKSRVVGYGSIDVSGVSGGYMDPIIYNSSTINADNGTGVDGITLVDTNNTSVGIELFASSANPGDSIYSNYYSNMWIYGTSICVEVASANGSNNNANSNNFFNINCQGPVTYGFYFSQGTGGAEVYYNKVIESYVENSNSSSALVGVYDSGAANEFIGVDLWDITSGQGYDFTSTSSYNIYDFKNNGLSDGVAPGLGIDVGVNNNPIQTLNNRMNGNVGINNANGLSALSVSGGATGGMSVNYATHASPSGGLIVQGEVGVGTFLPGSNATLTVAGRVQLGNATYAGLNQTTSTLISSGNVGIGTWLGKNNLTVTGNTVIGTAAAAGVTGPTNGLYVTGNVGIGTNNTGTALISVGGACTGKETLGACFGINSVGVTCLGYCTGAIGTCTACTCC